MSRYPLSDLEDFGAELMPLDGRDGWVIERAFGGVAHNAVNRIHNHQTHRKLRQMRNWDVWVGA